MKAKSNKMNLKLPPYLQIIEYIRGNYYCHLISLAAKLGIADLLAEGPKSLKELATMTDTHAPNLYRALRALTSIGIFDEKESKIFSQNSLSKILQINSPLSMKNTALMIGSDWYEKAWSNIFYSIKTGKPAFDNIFGMTLFEYFNIHPKDRTVYDNNMSSLTNLLSPVIINSYDFSKFQTIIDIGGGNGSLLMRILKNNPSLNGILYDIPEAVEGARKLLEKENLLKRCKIINGNFFQTVPKGGDAYILKLILHDWNDIKASRILRNCHKSMNPDSKLLLIEHVLSKGDLKNAAIFMDLEMMVFSKGGHERTEEEFRKLLNNAGFKLIKIIPIPPYFILEGRKNS